MRVCRAPDDSGEGPAQRRWHRRGTANSTKWALTALYRASGSGRSWKRTTLGKVPLPVSRWNIVRVA